MNGLKKYQLNTLIHKEYATSGKGDKEFAAYAAGRLEEPEITLARVRAARIMLGLPSNTTGKLPVELLELLKALHVYFTGFAKRDLVRDQFADRLQHFILVQGNEEEPK